MLETLGIWEVLLNMQKSALEHRAGGQSQFVKNERKNAPPLEENRKRDASRARPHRVGTRRRFFTSSQAACRRASQAYAEQARARSGARVATRRLLRYM